MGVTSFVYCIVMEPLLLQAKKPPSVGFSTPVLQRRRSDDSNLSMALHDGVLKNGRFFYGTLSTMVPRTKASMFRLLCNVHHIARVVDCIVD